MQGGERRGPANYFDIVYKGVKLHGFHIYAYASRFGEAEAALARWIGEGRLRMQEDLIEGLERMPGALRRLFEGGNQGKQVVRITDDPFAARRV
jgi:hypothetical protein